MTLYAIYVTSKDSINKVVDILRRNGITVKSINEQLLMVLADIPQSKLDVISELHSKAGVRMVERADYPFFTA